MKLLQTRHVRDPKSVVTQQKQDGFGQCLLKLGPASLLALFTGGLILILTAINALAGPCQSKCADKYDGIDHFEVGQTWSIQVWLVIVGAAFGLLSHGLLEAYLHLFDWWCSRRARSSVGLDYGRYLNTQPRAPVVYGIRGFPVFSTLRYFVLLASIATSIGYKFAIVNKQTPWREHVNPENLSFVVENMTQPFSKIGMQSAPSPWFMDSQLCFINTQPVIGDSISDIEAMRIIPPDLNGPNGTNLDLERPPLNISMVAAASRKTYLYGEAYGYITTREVAAIASVANDTGNFKMSRNESDWHRAGTVKKQWPGIDNEPAVVEYRILEHGKIQIQWAPLGPWMTDDNADELVHDVIQRVTYTMQYTTAEVKRYFPLEAQEGILSRYGSVIALGHNLPFPSIRKSNKFLETRSKWIDAQIADDETSVVKGVLAIVRGIMYEWAMVDLWSGRENGPFTGIDAGEKRPNFIGEHLRLLPAGDYPAGSEENVISERSEFYPELEYPYFIGTRTKGSTGCYRSASATFLAVGIMAWLIAVLRIWVGLAGLTSWTGQHVYLSQTGVFSSLRDQDDLSSGYLVAPAKLGRLRLHHTKANESIHFQEEEDGRPNSTDLE
jgi:hypothetical protein